MIEVKDELYTDLQKIKQIPVVPVMLDVICQTTGLGFAAVARVTENRWMACSVLDQVNFGLKEGGELKVETTLCDEIRDNRQPIIIDNVSKDDQYKEHHTPKTYGLQSYISYPIILKNGEFFGTLCAIGASPAELNNTKIRGLFSLFADLLSFHLESVEHLNKTQSVLEKTSRQLERSTNENLLYQQISSHHLQEPLRKIRIFTDILVNFTNDQNIEAAKKTAAKIQSFSNELSGMINHVVDFSSVNQSAINEQVNLNTIIEEVTQKLRPKTEQYMTRIISEHLPTVSAVADQMNRLFYNLLEHSMVFSKGDVKRDINIRLDNLKSKDNFYSIFIEQESALVKIYDSEVIFDMFIHSSADDNPEKYRTGLAICQKIVQNHGGELSVYSTKASGISFCIELPVSFNRN